MKKIREQKGTTLIEVFLVVSIFGVLTGLGVNEYAKFRAQTQLRESGYQLSDALHEARDRSMRAENGAEFGLCFSGDSDYRLSGNGACDQVKTNYRLSGATVFALIDLPEDKIFFEKLTGATTHSGSIRIKHPQIDAGMLISLESSGLIIIE